jgi:hypothetical protein
MLGNNYDVSGNGSGGGGQVMTGADIRVANRGTITLELTLPISQKSSVDFTITDQRTSNETTFSRDMNVGGMELVMRM